MILRLLAAAALALAASPALAAVTATAASPDKVLSVSVTTDNDGQPIYSVSRLGRPVIAPSKLGFILVDAPKLQRNFEVTGQQTRSIDETWDLPWGERKSVRNRFNELRVTLVEKTPLHRRLDVVFRLYDDGLGFRYEFPDQPNLK
ncbi:MAG: glycoside hydrolase family 97 N-terminal domain-containing protein, partial [Caulobacter sp.]